MINAFAHRDISHIKKFDHILSNQSILSSKEDVQTFYYILTMMEEILLGKKNLELLLNRGLNNFYYILIHLIRNHRITQVLPYFQISDEHDLMKLQDLEIKVNLIINKIEDTLDTLIVDPVELNEVSLLLNHIYNAQNELIEKTNCEKSETKTPSIESNARILSASKD
jgi:hypothetical protein